MRGKGAREYGWKLFSPYIESEMLSLDQDNIILIKCRIVGPISMSKLITVLSD